MVLKWDFLRMMTMVIMMMVLMVQLWLAMAPWRGSTSVDRCLLMAFINYRHSLKTKTAALRSLKCLSHTYLETLWSVTLSYLYLLLKYVWIYFYITLKLNSRALLYKRSSSRLICYSSAYEEKHVSTFFSIIFSSTIIYRTAHFNHDKQWTGKSIIVTN